MDRVDRGDVDDLTAGPLGDHLRCGELRAEEDASEVDVDHAHEVVLADLRERDEREDSRVVHEHVELLEVLHRLVHEPLHARPVGDVDRIREGGALPPFLEGLGGLHRVDRVCRSATTTFAPASCSLVAIASPIPIAPPVTMAVLPVRSSSSSRERFVSV